MELATSTHHEQKEHAAAPHHAAAVDAAAHAATAVNHAPHAQPPHHAEAATTPLREPIKPPEVSLAPDAPVSLAPVENPVPVALPPTTPKEAPQVAPVAANDAHMLHQPVTHAANDAHIKPHVAHVAPVVIMPEELLGAEQQLAMYLASKLDPALSNGLVLTLATAPNANSTDLKLFLEGPMIASNGELIAEQVMKALHAHPAFTHLSEEAKKFHAHKADGAENINHLRVDVPHLTNAEYASIVKSLNAPVKPLAHAAEVPSNIIATPAANVEKMHDAALQQVANGVAM